MSANNSFGGLAGDFVVQYAQAHQKNWRETDRLLRVDALAAWGNRPVSSLSRAEINRLLTQVANRAPITANRLMAALKKLFAWAVAAGKLSESPMMGMIKPAAERSRDRVLSDDELARLWIASNELGYPFGPFFKLLTLTAQRRDGVAHMAWSEIKGENWVIPSTRAKNGTSHIVHLSLPALEVLEQLREYSISDLVFTTTGKTPISGFSKAKQELSRLSGVNNWRFHDLRRTVTTGMANAEATRRMSANKILNHTAGTISGVQAVYQKAEFLTERRRALEDWASHVFKITGSDLP